MSETYEDSKAILLLGIRAPVVVAAWGLSLSVVFTALLLACFAARLALEGFQPHADKSELRVRNTFLQVPRPSMAKWTGGAARNALAIQAGSKSLNLALGTFKASFKKLNRIEGEAERSFALIVQGDAGESLLYIFNNIHGSIPVSSGVEQVPVDVSAPTGSSSSTGSGGVRP